MLSRIVKENIPEGWDTTVSTETSVTATDHEGSEVLFQIDEGGLVGITSMFLIDGKYVMDVEKGVLITSLAWYMGEIYGKR